MTDAWLTESPFTRDLGLDARSGDIVLTVTEPHTPHGALHGGATAALALTSAEAAMRADDPEVEPSPTSLHVTYARSGRGTTFTASSTTVRRTRELGFYQTEVRDSAGELIAGASSALSTNRAGAGEIPRPTPLRGDPAAITNAIAPITYLGRRDIRVEGHEPGAVDFTMGLAERNLDAKGRLHAGAVITLMDLAGASAPWTYQTSAKTGVTVALHVQLFGELPRDPVMARATVRTRDDRMTWTDVTVWRQEDLRVYALGHVAFRFD
ncbi:hypothetical protein GCM10029964_076800 [Kibdelosporangium lantanae]